MDALIALALSIAPELSRWLFGADIDKASAAVTAAFHTAIGTSDADAAAALLQKNPAAASHLRLQLLQVGAGLDETGRVMALAELTANLVKIDLGRVPAELASSSVVSWAAPMVSVAVLVSFGAVVMIILLKGVPTGNETTANMLLGTLAAMATSVVSYWVGSSAGSARKDVILSQITK